MTCAPTQAIPARTMMSLPRALALSFGQLGDPAILRVLGKSLVITLALFALLGWGLSFGFDAALAWAGITGAGGAGTLLAIVATLLGFLGGWLPGLLMRRGWPAVRARRAVMLGCALCLPVSALAVFAHHPWTAIVLVSLACGAHNGWSANIFTLTSDFFPQKAVGSVTGIGGFAGGVGGLFLATLAPGYIITWFGYIPVFIMMGVLHPLAWISLYLLTRKRDG